MDAKIKKEIAMSCPGFIEILEYLGPRPFTNRPISDFTAPILDMVRVRTMNGTITVGKYNGEWIRLEYRGIPFITQQN